MKNLLFALILTSAAMATAGDIPAPGECAWIQLQCDTDDYCAFITLKDSLDLRNLYVTDDGYFAAGGYRTNEGIMQLPADSGWDNVPLGTIVEIGAAVSADNDSADGFLGVLQSGINLSTSGDQVFLTTVDPSTATDETGIICGITTNINDSANFAGNATSSNDSARPAGAGNYVAVGAGSNSGQEYDNSVYTGGDAGSVSAFIAQVTNNANWTGNDSAQGARAWTGGAGISVPVEISAFGLE